MHSMGWRGTSVLVWAAAVSFAAEVYTNGTLLAQTRRWEIILGTNRHAVKDEIEEEMRSAAPWRVAVLQGTNGCYEWGLYARVYHGRALLDLRAPVEAYRSLAHAAGFSPLAGMLAAPYAVQTNTAGGLDFLLRMCHSMCARWILRGCN